MTHTFNLTAKPYTSRVLGDWIAAREGGAARAGTVESRVNDDGTRALRYAIDDVYDSGFIVDENNDYDPSMTGLAVGYVFDTPGAGWSLDFTNVRYRWSR